MNVTCIEYEEATGKILMSTSMPIDLMEDHNAFLPGAAIKWIGYGEPFPNQRTQYVDLQAGSVTDRPTMPASLTKTMIAADDLDEAVLSSIPEGANITVDGQLVALDGDALTLTAAMPATYRLVVECWPYLPFEAEIVAQ